MIHLFARFRCPAVSSFVCVPKTMTIRLIIAILGIAVSTIGSIAIAGYIFQVSRFYGWLVDRQAMALNTAVAFVMVGLALALIGTSHRLWKTDG